MRQNKLEPFGLLPPTTDFERVRDGRNSMPLWLDIDLSSARSISAGTALLINIAGNSFYVDNDNSNVGTATVHFQDTNLGNASAPFLVSAGFIANVGFTQILIENTAQASKRLRIFYGVDIDFQAGVNASINAVNQTEVRKAFSQAQNSVGTTAVQVLAGNVNRDYLLVQNTHASATIYINVSGVTATTANGVKVGPGGSYELATTVPTGAISVISDTAATPVMVVEA